MIYMGIDPGQSGAMAAFLGNISEPGYHAFGKKTEMDINSSINDLKLLTGIHGEIYAMLENVHSMPKQGVASSFKFGKHFGFLIGILTANKIPFEFVTPQKWQKAMGCMTGGDKNVSKAAAQRLCPTVKMTHAIADAILIAEYCRRTLVMRSTHE